MIWWFVILAVSAGAVLWAAIAAYLRVRRHLKNSGPAITRSSVNTEGDSV
jgi:hypothetical protein